jgi:hypothetical protein
MHLKRDGTRAETRFPLSPKRTSPFKSVGASVQSTAGSRDVGVSDSNAGYTTFRRSVRFLATHSIRQFPTSLPLLCVTVSHQVSKALYYKKILKFSEHRSRKHPLFMSLSHCVYIYIILMLNPIATRSKAWFCGRSLAEIEGSNPGVGIYFCLL